MKDKRQEKIIKLLNNSGITVENLDNTYVINGEINPILEITLEKPIEQLGDNAVQFESNEIKHIIFKETGICIKINSLVAMGTHIGLSNENEDIQFLMQDGQYRVLAISINKHGEINSHRLA